MRVDVALTPALLPAAARDAPVVVIDVLRATSTIVCALAAGAAGVRPVADLQAAAVLARQCGAVLGGEREGLAPPGYDLGNSPASYDIAACGGRHVVLCTTNGTQAVAALGPRPFVLAGCLLNAEVTARALAESGAAEVLLVCSGTRGRLAADDAAAAGCLAGSLALMAAAEPTDGARLAIALFDAWKHDLPGLLSRCESGRRLQRIGLSADIAFCAQVDRVPVLAQLDDEGVFRNMLAGLDRSEH